MGLESKYYKVNGISLHVFDKGDENSPIIIFLHGFPEFWFCWRKQFPFFLKHGFRVIIPDQRGYNLTDKPKTVKDYSVDNLVEDILQLIKIVSKTRVYLVAHDWGAAIAWRIASEYPEVLVKMVIINLAHPSVMRNTLKKSFRQQLKSWYIAFFQIPILPEIALRSYNFKILEKILTETSLKSTFTKEDISEYKLAWKKPGAIKSMINWYRALRFAKPVSTPTKIVVPTLIIWGEKDVALVKEMAKKNLDFCEKGKLFSIPEATHWVHQDKSDLVNDQILAFFKE